ncbi:MAG TPA: TadG family pilus assembly protein [Rhizomicrobium sp.]|jgi:uncharacterized membrane protein
MKLGHILKWCIREERASIAVITGISMVMFVGFSGAAVDFGSVYLQSRQLQGVADLAAMSAAGNLNQAQTAAQDTVNQNGLPAGTTATAVVGTYTPDGSIPVNQRFTPNGSSPNAAQVTVTSNASIYFARILLGKNSIPVSRTAVAASGQLASFSIGTQLAGLQGGVENALLSSLTGSSVSLSVMDYNSLLNANVDLFQYMGALATRLNLTGVSFNQTLQTQVQSGTAVAAIADVLKAAGNSGAASAVYAIANAANQQQVDLGQLLNLGPYQDQDYIETNGPSGFSVNALDMANAVLELAQGGRQVQLNLNSTIPGVSSITAWLAIGQRPSNSPWLTITDDNSMVISTAQARLYIDAQIAPVGLSGISVINLPVYVELASAQAKLSSVACEPTNPEAVNLSVSPSIGETAIGSIDTGQLNNFTQELTISPATMINVPLLMQVTGQSIINLGGNDWQNVSFDASDIQNQTVKTVSTNNAITAALTSLVGNLSLNVNLLGLNLGLSPNAVTQAVDTSIGNVAQPLDSVVNELTGLLGVGLGEADVWVNGVRCQNVALVQ